MTTPDVADLYPAEPPGSPADFTTRGEWEAYVAGWRRAAEVFEPMTPEQIAKAVQLTRGYEPGRGRRQAGAA